MKRTLSVIIRWSPLEASEIYNPNVLKFPAFRRPPRSQLRRFPPRRARHQRKSQSGKSSDDFPLPVKILRLLCSAVTSAHSPMSVQDGNGGAAAAAEATAVTAVARHDRFSSFRDVTYSCGSCGYTLNLSSSKRNTTNFGSKYGKAMKKGIISFFSIDESRFLMSEEYRCIPYFNSKRSWGLFWRRTKLLCGKCRNHIGFAYEKSPSRIGVENPDSGFEDETAVCKNYNIKISALQPSSGELGVPLLVDTGK